MIFVSEITAKRAICTRSRKGEEGIETLGLELHMDFIEGIVNMKVKVNFHVLQMSHCCPSKIVLKYKKPKIRY